jgi:AcrR family transcriptional regulator
MTLTPAATATREVLSTIGGASLQADGGERPKRTKLRYLDTALELASRHAALDVEPDAQAVAHVQIADVAATAGVTRTALYRLWPTQDAFRSDLASYLAARDDAPWMSPDTRYLDPSLTYPDGFCRLTREVFNTVQDDLADDLRPLLRAGIAGHPHAASARHAIAEREGWRLGRHGDFLCKVLENLRRRCVSGITATDISVTIACVADGLALARRTSSTEQLQVGSDDQSWSLLALAVCALFDGLTEPDHDPPGASGEQTSASASPPQPQVEPAGRRRHYLDVAAMLAARSERQEAGGDALGGVGLDALARAERMTRAAFRKLWPTQAAFGLDVAAHMVRRHRQAVAKLLGEGDSQTSVSRAGPLDVGDRLAQFVKAERTRVSHLTVAPQLILPDVQDHLRQQAAPLLEGATAALRPLLLTLRRRVPADASQQLAILVVALVDGVTRVDRTLSTPTASLLEERPDGLGRSHTLLAMALDALLRRSGLAVPVDFAADGRAGPTPCIYLSHGDNL